ncbi:MAG: filamentous hemagglutinin N-terminal domain-containing protein [Okeania sp. SIO3I5]|uniref:two-partner secretion domain-containing protein n=1 Tax=Okeania sp. SIO3I5 TaxID=2607805 RepID=UPI0013B69420|nr:filamentous hemagglutinin N-terminal domain-containing protein [Okeania sp. SIO3I5]NEQ40546.1 filamentous hemagglutinin N-terminal domain-containing protein [Okeania sp. SIO3I5]
MPNCYRLKTSAFLTTCLISSIWNLSLPSVAQIVPDATLPNNTRVIINGNRFTIDNGTTIGDNLFHSFQDFSLPTGTEVFFDNSVDISNIINRVTGGNISNIDGLIRANGTANFFLINPNGIVFGPNARLNVGGSFISSTAESLIFSDGSFYSATNPNAPPILTINRPIGLQVGPNPGAIRVEGNGHGFTVENVLFGPIDRSQANTGLQVNPGQTLALIGGNIDLEGGVLTAEGGQIELGAIAEGRVGWSFQPSGGFAFNYDSVENFGDINLLQQASADTSGAGSGSIQITGRQVTLRDGSVGLNQNEGSQPGGEISVTATDLLTIEGTNPDASIPSRLQTYATAAGKGGDITISTGQLRVQNGGQITPNTASAGDGGNLTINASEFIEVSGDSPLNPGLAFSLVGGNTVGEGNAGEVNISTQRLSLLNGGNVSNPTFGSGNAGDITVNVGDLIELIGQGTDGVTFSNIGTTAAVGSGNSGDAIINTGRLLVSNGAFINSSTFDGGNAGNLTINASEFIEVKGINPLTQVPARIESSAPIVGEATRQAFGIPDQPSGNSGNLTINTPQIIISEGGIIGVNNEGTGRAGNLQINADSVFLLDTEASISATTASGEGGNINVTAGLLELRRSSQITTEAGGTGNGGDIDINAENVVILENSQINANAFEGAGGNINITTEGLFQSDNSEITASSALGVAGIVTINNPEVDPSAAITDLPEEPVDLSQVLVSGCFDNEDSSFIYIARGGLPISPLQPFIGKAVWQDLEDYTVSEEPTFSKNQIVTHETLPQYNNQLVESTGWITHPDGRVELVAVIPNQSWYPLIDCQTLNNS